MVHAISKHQVINLEQHTNDEYESSIFTSCMNMYVVWTFSRHIKKIRRDNQVEEGSHLNTVKDIATALNQIIRRIQEES
ncbi:hypothetical protein YC2023_083812 [Brassica napus]